MHANDWVEVRSKQEILETLDKNGRLDGMPFMPQMFEYCGKRFRVHKSAHKTCDPVYTIAARHIPNAVHLNLRCDGKAYGGCQAGCRLFWKEAWLKSVDPATAGGSALRDEDWRNKMTADYRGCTEEDVWRGTRRDGRLGESNANTLFVCQNTQLPEFSKPLSWWDPSQYFKDYVSGNVSLGEMTRGALYVLFGRRFGTKIPLLPRTYNAFQKLTGGMPTPVAHGEIPRGEPHPVVNLNLQPGDLVRVRSQEEILATINKRNTNRGLSFDAEMVPYCGGVYRVRRRVERFLDEKTGRMRSLKTPAVILENVFCRSRFSRCRMFCPRELFAWWREVWLERIEEPGDFSGTDEAALRLPADAKSLAVAEAVE